jgi:hypothetical protein
MSLDGGNIDSDPKIDFQNGTFSGSEYSVKSSSEYINVTRSSHFARLMIITRSLPVHYQLVVSATPFLVVATSIADATTKIHGVDAQSALISASHPSEIFSYEVSEPSDRETTEIAPSFLCRMMDQLPQSTPPELSSGHLHIRDLKPETRYQLYSVSRSSDSYLVSRVVFQTLAGNKNPMVGFLHFIR